MTVDVSLGRPMMSTTGESVSAIPRQKPTTVWKNPASTCSTSCPGSEQNALVYKRCSPTCANENARRYDTYNGREAEMVE